ncbi:hypothetical protein FOZ63_031971 [Perkinsus olseni]|uniref:Uncharacterized protein n=1 Tax=Perkinsus olseni TaxID=32597 RepID=A0A7J6TS48_PEROL|nr:hypothetical protein FOZ63_031971 [Perkinsus olseni]
MGHRSLITRYQLIAWALIVPTLAGPVADLPHRDTSVNEPLPDGLPGLREALGKSSSCAVVGSPEVAVGGVSFLKRVCSRIVVVTPNITEMSFEHACFAKTDNDESRLPHEPLGPPKTLMPPDVRYFPVDSHADIWSTFALGSNIRAIVLDHSQRVGHLREDLRNALRIGALRLIIFIRNSDEVSESLKGFQDDNYTHCQQQKIASTGKTVQALQVKLASYAGCCDDAMSGHCRLWGRYVTSSALRQLENGYCFGSNRSDKALSCSYTIRFTVNGFLINVIETDPLSTEERELVGTRRRSVARMVQREFNM